MSSMVLLFSALCLLCSCWGEESSRRSARDIPLEPLDAPSDDLEPDASRWQPWKPWNIFKWDSQRTLTRRESSLIADKPYSEGYDTGRTRSTTRVLTESSTSLALHPPRPHGSVRRELVTSMFETMLDYIVESWEVIPPPVKPEDLVADMIKTPSEQTYTSKKSKKVGKEPSGRTSRTKRLRNSKLELLEETQERSYQCWWSAPDERAIIHFKNGNIYEGNISMKRMHGEGRYQWVDGTVYLGQFKDNEMHGKGLLHWKDDTWYEGNFAVNVRHGRGLYVDSRKQAHYCGEWHRGAKHGKGALHYPASKTNSYDGDWKLNVRHGSGQREYSHESGYRGEWNTYTREGHGLMIWPNHDFYRGGWNNGVMSGYGKYIWNAYYNNTMTLPSISAFRGLWHKGQRNGYGYLSFGLGLGSHYKGNFRNNKKHGPGKLVTNNGLILQNNKTLFIDDILGPVTSNSCEESPPPPDSAEQKVAEPYQFDICSDAVGLIYHIQTALNNLDKKAEIRTNIINEYLENNKLPEAKSCVAFRKESVPEYNIDVSSLEFDDIMQFEEMSIRKAIRNYETDLKNIYYHYATVCDTEGVDFPPVMIRLYLWQFYYDCNIHELGLSLVEIDKMFGACPDWLARHAHDPFEKIYFWQFLHSLISVANKLYAQKQLPEVKPDTILSSAFRTFMENDALPGSGRHKGLLVNGYGSFVPLKGAYELYQMIGEPHTVRQFLCATRRPPHFIFPPRPDLVDSPDEATPIGRNIYIFGDKMTFITDEPMPTRNEEETEEDELRKTLKLFNFGNLSSKSIINIFSQIFPRLCSNEKIMDLDIEMTFHEFFEAFVACTQKSIRVKDEEMRWKEKFSDSDEALHYSTHPLFATVKAHK